MARHGSLKWIFLSLSFAVSVCASPAMAEDYLNDPTLASGHIDDLAKEVYKLGNATKANADLDEYCRKIQENLRGAARSDWEPIVRKCVDAQRTMKAYNSGVQKRKVE